MPGNNQGVYDQDEEFFLVEELDRIKLSSSGDVNYFWVDPRIYNSQNQKNLKYFQDQLKIQPFTSVQSLKNQLDHMDTNQVVKVISAASLKDQNYKYMNQQRKIAEIYLFCQNQERAKLLMSNFPKIKGVGFSCSQILELSKKHSSKKNNASILSSALFMIDEDANILNKYRLNYYCLTNQTNKSRAKAQFAELSKKLFPQQKNLIEQFQKEYSLSLQGEQRRNQTMKWAFKDSFYWSLVETLPKTTTDPRRLAYLRTAFKDLYESIFEGYKEIKKKPSELFIVVDLNQDQIAKLGDNIKNYIIFTTFIKGFSNQAEAMKQFKKRGDSAFLFEVLTIKKKVDKNLDFGYVINPQKAFPNVIFNIYNFFKIDQVNTSAKVRRGTLLYGSLAQIFKIREDPDMRNKLNQNQKGLLRNYDYLQDLMKKIKNQGNILQLSGYYKQSISLYDRKLEQITRTNKPATMQDQYRIQKGDSLKMNQDYDQAAKMYNQVQTEKLKAVAQVRLLELHFIRQNYAQIDKILAEMESKINLLKDWGFVEDYFRAKNYIGLNLMKKDKNRQANKVYKKLRQQVADYYVLKLEGIPLVHEIYRNLALSQTKINNYEQALNLLNSSKGWQQSCQGKGPSLILTQKLIQNVHVSKGDKQMIEESQANIDQMVIDQSAVNVNLVDISRGATKIQQGIQQSMVQINLDSSAAWKKPVNIEQSAVNVELSVPKKKNLAPIEQSSVDINF